MKRKFASPVSSRRLWIGALLGSLLVLSPATFAVDLPARAFLGIGPQAAEPDAADAADQGVIVGVIAPNSSAEALGLALQDRIERINGLPIRDFDDIIALVANLEVGAELHMEVRRGDEPLSLHGQVKGRVRETSTNFEVIYGALDVGSADQPSVIRTITYRPPGATAQNPHPVVFHIQGYNCASIDYGSRPEVTVQQILVSLAEAGYVVHKQEKPGVGDSLGPDCDDIDFATEMAAFSAGLAFLHNLPYVDSDHVHIFGYSLGGVQGPLLARDHAVKSIIAYGATVDSWRDYMLDIYGRQSMIFGVPETQAALNRARVQPLIDAWLTTDRSWADIAEDPELQPLLAAGLVQAEGERIFGRHYRFFRGLNRENLAEAWRSINSHALAMHGSLDIQAIDSSWTDALVEIVHNPPERIAEAVILENAEHAFMVFESRIEQLTVMNQGLLDPSQPGERYDSRAVAAMLDWLMRFSPPPTATTVAP